MVYAAYSYGNDGEVLGVSVYADVEASERLLFIDVDDSHIPNWRDTTIVIDGKSYRLCWLD